MKSVAISVTVIVGSLCTVPVAHAGATLDKVMREKTLVEVTDQAYPPFSSMGDNNEIVGFDIDVAREVAKRLGVELKVETPAWEVITAGNWKGRWDICVCSMTPTKERAEVLDFVAEYYAAPATIVVNSADDRIKTAKDLTGMKVGVEGGTTYEKYLQKTLVVDLPGAKPVEFPFGDVEIVPYDSEITAFQDLGLGAGKRIDAIVSGYITAKDHIAKSDGKFKAVGTPLYNEPIWVATDKGDAEWEAKIKEIFTQMQADGALKAISMKWIGIDITTGS